MSGERLDMIRQRLTAALAPQRLDIADESLKHAGHAGARSGGGHYVVTIVSAAFSGKSLLQRHRMVYDALSDVLGAEIHALSIKTHAPEENP